MINRNHLNIKDSVKKLFMSPILLSFASMPAHADNIINFEDLVVKQICVENWDTNGDGELSEEEAANVTNLGNSFRSNDQIKSFKELMYFTTLDSICKEAFINCYNLKSVVVPNSVKAICKSSFYECI